MIANVETDSLTMVAYGDHRVLGWKKNRNKGRNVVPVFAPTPEEVVAQPAKEADLSSMIAINDTGFFDIETEFRDDGPNQDMVRNEIVKQVVRVLSGN